MSESIHADSLFNDPRISQARDLYLEALKDHRQELKEPRPPVEGRKAAFEDLIKSFSADRGGSLYYPYLGSGLGNGALVELADGSVKYDMITGIGVHYFGHSDPELVAASLDAALQNTVMQGNLQQNTESALLCRELIEIASADGAPIQHCFLSTSGATANENALKMLFQAKQPASRMMAFSNCFSGRTLATSQLTDRPQNRVGLPTVMAVDYIPFFNADCDPQNIQTTLDRVSEFAERYPGQHAGMIMEIIQGEGGYYTAPREFFVALCEQLREYEIPIWFDEIQTFGRTTSPFAFQHYQLDEFADIVTVGKMTQVCATLFRDELKPQPGLISQTFTGSTSSVFAARSILKRLREGDFFGPVGRNMQVHHRFQTHFEAIQQRIPGAIFGPWGLGGMIGFSVFDGSAAKTRAVLNGLFDAGVLAFPAGANPTRIRMLPPIGAITDTQIDEVCSIIESVLKGVSES